jgi:D-lactate dehydrogenase (cytochrome)
VETDADLLHSFLSDAAHVPGGAASGIAFPRDVAEVAALVARAERVLPIGAQSSLTGGATPRGDLLLSTRALTTLEPPEKGTVRVGAGVPLKTLQAHLAAHGRYYPPVPIWDGAFIGGTIATNAAGAATFKYGTTRRWVEGLLVVLADGSVLDLRRGAITASPDGWFEIESPSGDVARVPVPRYTMPAVPKLSAGYFAAPGMDLIDLFIGSEGTLGVIVEATLRLVDRRRQCVALIECVSEDQAVAVTAALRREAAVAWDHEGPLDVAAVEFIDARSLALLGDELFVQTGVPRPPPGAVLLVAQFEAGIDAEPLLIRLQEVLDACGVAADPIVALPGDTVGAARLFELREAVPASVNARIGVAQTRDPGVQKTGGDMIVPFERLSDSLALYHRVFEAHGLRYAVWGHASDGNLHPNVLPSTTEDVARGVTALREIAAGVVRMGGAALAEHGVGRSPVKQQFLRDLYGANGILQMRAVKRALDPAGKLAPGVLFPESAG